MIMTTLQTERIDRAATDAATTGPATAERLPLQPSTAAGRLRHRWRTEPRWARIERSFTAEDVIALRGSLIEEHTLARFGAEKLWRLLQERTFVRSLGALTGNQAVQQVKAGLEAIYLSGW